MTDTPPTIGARVTLADCPVGLFVAGSGALCLKTQYSNNEGRIDAYLITGEFFWGDQPQTIASQRDQLVTPVFARVVHPLAIGDCE